MASQANRQAGVLTRAHRPRSFPPNIPVLHKASVTSGSFSGHLHLIAKLADPWKKSLANMKDVSPR